MKLSNVPRTTAAALLSFAACLGLTACSRDYTVGFLYVLSTRGSAADQNGQIGEYGIDFQTGALTVLSSSGQSSMGRNPVGLVIHPNQKNVYVINHDDSTILPLLIGTDGKLYPGQVKSLDGIFPTSIGISADGGYLYISFTYRKTSATSNSGPGGIEVFKLNARSDASGGYDIGAAVSSGGNPYFNVGVNPVSIAVGPNLNATSASPVNQAGCVTTPSSCVSYVYVAEQDTNTLNNLLVFSRDIGTGALTPVTVGQYPTTVGTAGATGALSGVTTSSVAVSPRGTFVYVTDSASNQIIAYGVGAGGQLRANTDGPFATGSLPVQMTIDPRGSFLYVADQNDSALSAYVINQSNGSLSSVSGVRPPTEGAGTNCVAIENALGQYLFTTNFISNNVSGFQLNTTTGALSKIRNSPFPGQPAPSCLAAIANGTHSTQLVQ